MIMILLWIAIILFILSVASLIKDGKKDISKGTILLLIYSAFFTYFAKITNDPIPIPYIGEISPDTVFLLITGISGAVVSKIYNFFMSFKIGLNNIQKELSEIKSSFNTHTSVCKEKHEGLNQRLSTIENKK